MTRSSADEVGTQRADRAQSFFEKVLHHTKGRYARQPFTLTDWQRDEIIKPLFGTVRWDDKLGEYVRQYRMAWLSVARKNGKSELLAGMALMMLCADDEESAEVYGGAVDRDQAALVFNVAKRMVELSPILSRRLEVVDSRKRIIDPKTNSVYQVIASDAAGNLGQDPHAVFVDEVEVQKNRDFVDALRTGFGSRVQPLIVLAGTAGNDPTSFAASEHEYSMRVQNDPKLDPSRFVYIRETPKDADWQDEKNWTHANPALGDFLSIDVLRDEAREAKQNPALQNTFRQFRLNQWVQQYTRWLSLDDWDASAGLVVEDELKGTCYGGLDLASTTDIAALCWVFPQDDSFAAVWRFWIPTDRLADLDSRTGGQASVWVRDGYLQTTEGNVIDYKAVKKQILDDVGLKGRWDFGRLSYDRWGMTQLSQDLMEEGLEVTPMGQGFASMSSPTKEWERLVLQGRFHHGGNPVMRWMVDNIAIKQDPAGNIKIDKAKSFEKVDGPVATVMALDGAIRVEQGSVYEAHGLTVI